MRTTRVSRWALAAGVVWLAATATLTLLPGSMSPADLAEVSLACLVCGSRGSADALLNTALFLPLGFLLGGTRRALLIATAVGFALSASIEIAQTGIPGRHAAMADVLWNTVGAAVGVLLFGLVRKRLGPAPTTREAVAWLVAAAAVLHAGGLLSTPAPTERDYWALFTPRLFGVEEYDGTVLSARLEDAELAWGPVEAAAASALRRPVWVLSARIVVGPEPRHPAPVVVLGNPEPDPAEVVFLGVHRDGLVFRERMAAHQLRFDAPDLRLDGGLAALAPGDSATFTVRRLQDRTTCLEVDAVQRCGLAVTPGRVWGFLQYLEGPSERVRRVVDVVWLVCLFAPAGFFAVGRRARLGTLIAAPLVVAGSAVATPLGLDPMLELPAAAAGVLLGLGAAVGVRLLAPRPDTDDEPGRPLPASS